MVAAGILERIADPDDARAKRVPLSARGRTLLSDVEVIWADLETVLRAAHGGSLPAVRTVS